MASLFMEWSNHKLSPFSPVSLEIVTLRETKLGLKNVLGIQKVTPIKAGKIVKLCTITFFRKAEYVFWSRGNLTDLVFSLGLERC